ncbi:uncharacterized protein PHACADRAFT_196585 [Phanerochaete carnosa HHB-10118-sp]|uniref:DUF6533 domain-containing protein n=1 Tax=Phanerochaete carnosa (strain HHB-10118-sp) TaxID=650164 RepID=K5W4S8_PHACS|nr:uncharacterized protein PHACADRAFT_196585 [Phanerochaete carnosa HHB-10118-sp]EKM54155.1 hypothetical protein PHACADRAFT_196585 [Phanerochaete carnosa HHB-10118-sp]
MQEIVQALRDVNATRYMTAVGLTVLLYDHVLTFCDEVRLVWRAPSSFPKYAFLFNRYLVPVCLLLVSYEMCGFVGEAFTDEGCRRLLFACSMLSLASVAVGNILVLMRVVILWDRRRAVMELMVAGFIVCFSAQSALMVISLVKFWPGLQWNSVAGMCITTTKTPFFSGVWAAPMFFEVLVLVSTVLNALDRPSQAALPITRSLHRDGITYFLAVTCFRVLNLTLSIVAQPSETMVVVFFIWGMTTTILNRSLLRMRKMELSYLEETEETEEMLGRSSPFGASDSVVIVDLDAPPHRSSRWLELNKMSNEF